MVRRRNPIISEARHVKGADAIQVGGELRSREYDSKKTDSKQRIWEIKVDSILKLDRSAPEDAIWKILLARKWPLKALPLQSRGPG